MFIQRSAAERPSKVLSGFVGSSTDNPIRDPKCPSKVLGGFVNQSMPRVRRSAKCPSKVLGGFVGSSTEGLLATLANARVQFWAVS